MRSKGQQKRLPPPDELDALLLQVFPEAVNPLPPVETRALNRLEVKLLDMYRDNRVDVVRRFAAPLQQFDTLHRAWALNEVLQFGIRANELAIALSFLTAGVDATRVHAQVPKDRDVVDALAPLVLCHALAPSVLESIVSDKRLSLQERVTVVRLMDHQPASELAAMRTLARASNDSAIATSERDALSGTDLAAFLNVITTLPEYCSRANGATAESRNPGERTNVTDTFNSRSSYPMAHRHSVAHLISTPKAAVPSLSEAAQLREAWNRMLQAGRVPIAVDHVNPMDISDRMLPKGFAAKTMKAGLSPEQLALLLARLPMAKRTETTALLDAVSQLSASQAQVLLQTIATRSASDAAPATTPYPSAVIVAVADRQLQDEQIRVLALLSSGRGANVVGDVASAIQSIRETNTLRYARTLLEKSPSFRQFLTRRFTDAVRNQRTVRADELHDIVDAQHQVHRSQAAAVQESRIVVNRSLTDAQVGIRPRSAGR